MGLNEPEGGGGQLEIGEKEKSQLALWQLFKRSVVSQSSCLKAES